VIKVASLLLEKEVITRENMIDLLGKRPFVGRSDDMDKWLDENHQKVPSPPPMPHPPPEAEEPIPGLVTAATRVNERF